MRSFQIFRATRGSIAKLNRPYSSLRPALHQTYRHFHASTSLQKIEQHVLSDIGEGVKEVQIIQWFVEEGAAVEEWAPLCEVQSDKASVEITSKFGGVIKKIHFERDAVVQVGDTMLDIEVEGEDDPEPEPEQDAEREQEADHEEKKDDNEGEKQDSTVVKEDVVTEEQTDPPKPSEQPSEPPKTSPAKPSGKHANLATPAVRGLLKEHKLEIQDIEGTGKDGRVLKEDVFRHLDQKKQPQQDSTPKQQYTPPASPALNAKQEETPQNLTPIQSAMFKSMTKSLQIPHFLYSDTVNVTTLGGMRSGLNDRRNKKTDPKLSYMPFVIKAVSLALNKYPALNARLDTSEASKPKLLLRKNHNIGVAMDTAAGLLVPVIKTVNARSIVSIAHELSRLAELGAAGKLSSEDLSGGTITVSNIGNIGGGVLAPVIVEGQLAIMGMGKIKATPVFGADGKSIERADMLSTSWSADHRVIDGATMARMAKIVQDYLEHPETMMIDMS